jgi:phenylpropionate dioxygenase-like ring-hydroxylating dioxygenase large terminal subunit
MHPLHPSIYFDTSIFEKELSLLFQKGPGYVGHEKIIPHVGDYYTLKHEQDARTLVHTETGIECISNICRHRQAIMLQNTGKTKAITCPLHKWTWDLHGTMK